MARGKNKKNIINAHLVPDDHICTGCGNGTDVVNFSIYNWYVRNKCNSCMRGNAPYIPKRKYLIPDDHRCGSCFKGKDEVNFYVSEYGNVRKECNGCKDAEVKKKVRFIFRKIKAPLGEVKPGKVIKDKKWRLNMIRYDFQMYFLMKDYSNEKGV